MPTLTLTDLVGSSPAQPATSTLAKRPHAHPLVLTIEDGNTTDQDNTLKLKKLKRSTIQPAVMAPQNEVSIIDINDIDDKKTEQLNKSKQTADIQEFFILMPLLPGQDKPDKPHMLCSLCE